MRTIKTNLYQYAELSEDAQQKAREWYTGKGFEFDAGVIIEDVKRIATILGVNNCEVFYSGFWSQGDGACINGTYHYTKGALKVIKEYAPMDTELHDIIKQLQDAQRKAFYKTIVKITHSGGYCHYNSMDFNHENELYPDLDDRSDSCKEIEEAFKDFARWIYKQLEKDYYYQTSNEAVIETIEANEYEFLINGKKG